MFMDNTLLVHLCPLVKSATAAQKLKLIYKMLNKLAKLYYLAAKENETNNSMCMCFGG